MTATESANGAFADPRSGSAHPLRQGSSPAEFPIDRATELLGEFNAKMGLRLLEATADRVVGTIPVDGNRQPYGLIHGGANAALIEALGSVAAALNAPDGRAPVGLELSCTHHRAARSGVVTGVCTPLSAGRTVSSFEVVITDDAGRRTCTGRLTCVLRERPPGS